jgi:transcriptional regulator with XRE-family HTH domain
MFPIVTQERAAEVAGVAVATYRKWERGIGAPDIIQLQRLKKEFGWGQIRDC